MAKASHDVPESTPDETPAEGPDELEPTPAPETSTSERTHVVKRQESLMLIAARHGTTWPVLHELNRDALGDSPHSIRVGQKLRLP